MTLSNLFKLVILMFSVSHAAYGGERITVYAASSMTNAINALTAEYQQETGNSVVSVFAGTSSLARQIEQGAPADIFISANQRWSHYLIDNGITSSDRVTKIAANSLVVVSNQALELTLNDINSWKRALNHQRFAMGQPTSVPVGIYTKEALISLQLWNDLQHDTAPTNNVRTALALAERGEVPFAIVYLTDAKLNNELNVIATIPTELHSEIVYPMAQLNDKPATQSFVDFVLSQQGQMILRKFGFQ